MLRHITLTQRECTKLDIKTTTLRRKVAAVNKLYTKPVAKQGDKPAAKVIETQDADDLVSVHVELLSDAQLSALMITGVSATSGAATRALMASEGWAPKEDEEAIKDGSN